MVRGLIVTVDRSPELVKHSIRELRPQLVCFLCPEECIEQATDMRKTLNIQREKTRVQVVNVYELADVIAKFYDAYNWLRSKRLRDEQIAVDITGATKKVEVAISALAGFMKIDSYCTERERVAEEQPAEPLAPPRLSKIDYLFEILGLPFLQLGVDYFNERMYGRAGFIFDQLKDKTSTVKRRMIFAVLASLSKSYLKWDLFSYVEAQQFMRSSLQFLQEVAKEARKLNSLKKQLSRNKEFLDRLLGETLGLKRLSPLLVIDLYSAGVRALEQGRLNDAVTRFYRSTEAAAQYRLLKRYGIDVAAVDSARIESKVLERFRSLAGFDLPQHLACFESYLLLKVLEDEFGRSVPEEELRHIMFIRNYSILAHGFRTTAIGEIQSLEKKVNEIIRRLFLMEDIDFNAESANGKHILLSQKVLRSVIL